MHTSKLPLKKTVLKTKKFGGNIYHKCTSQNKEEKKIQLLPGGESNPGLPRDRRGYSPLYYRGPSLSNAENLIYLLNNSRHTVHNFSQTVFVITKERLDYLIS